MVDVEAEHFSLRWNNFHSNLSTGFQALLQEEDLVDVTLAASGEFVQAHKIVLSVCSPYFKQLFKVNPCKHPIVILKDVCHKDLVDILQFMYQGEVNVRQEDLATFLKTAELLQIKGLTGRDSPADSQEHEKPIHSTPRPRSMPKPRSARSHVDKITLTKPQMHVHVEKKVCLDSEEPISHAPPYKRVRSEPQIRAPSPPSPHVKEDPAEYLEMANPKEEPADSDMEQGDKLSAPDRIQEDPLLQLLSADSSHGTPTVGGPSQSSGGPTPAVGVSPLTSGPMVSIPSISQDSTPTQEGSQGRLHYVESKQGKLQLVHDGYIYNLNQLSGNYKHWYCINYRHQGCRSHCKTYGDLVVADTCSHNHERQFSLICEKIKQAEFRKRIIIKKRNT